MQHTSDWSTSKGFIYRPWNEKEGRVLIIKSGEIKLHYSTYKVNLIRLSTFDSCHSLNSEKWDYWLVAEQRQEIVD